jgi:hypothetical protein
MSSYAGVLVGDQHPVGYLSIGVVEDDIVE